MENLKYIPFNQVNFSDAFFDSLKADYSHGFVEWFNANATLMTTPMYSSMRTILLMDFFIKTEEGCG
jgi:hypothetical protein